MIVNVFSAINIFVMLWIIMIRDFWQSENGRPPSRTVGFRLRMAVLRPVHVPFYYFFLDSFFSHL
jgi:hypothetical protein